MLSKRSRREDSEEVELGVPACVMRERVKVEVERMR